MTDKTFHNLRLFRLQASNFRCPDIDVDMNGAGVVWLYGPNGTGKSTITEAIRLTLQHKFWEDSHVRFTQAARAGGKVREAFAYGSGPVTLHLGTSLGTSEFSLDKRTKVTAKGLNLSSAEGSHEDMAERLRRSPAKMVEELAGMALEGLTEDDLQAAVDDKHKPAFTTAWGRTKGTIVNRFDAMVADTNTRLKRAKADLQALAGQKPAITPVQVDQKRVDAITSDLRLLAQQLSNSDAWENFDEQRENALKWREWLTEQEAALVKKEEVLRSTASQYTNLINYYDSLHKAIAAYRWLNANNVEVQTIWPAEWGPEQIEWVSDTVSAKHMECVRDRDNDPNVAPLRAEVQALRNSVNQNRRHAALPSEPDFARPSGGSEQLRAEQGALQRERDNLLRMQGMWAQERRRLEQLDAAGVLVETLSSFLTELKGVRKALITERIDAFVARCNAYLPAVVGDRLFIDLDKARVGVIRDGIERAKVSGGEWSVIVTCFCLAAAESKPVPPIVILNDVNMHSELVHDCVRQWNDYRGVIIIQSAMAPSKDVPSYCMPIEAAAVTGMVPGSWGNESVKEATEVKAGTTKTVADAREEAIIAQLLVDAGLPAGQKKDVKAAKKKAKFVWKDVACTADIFDIALNAKCRVVKQVEGAGGAIKEIDVPARLKGIRAGEMSIQLAGQKRHRFSRDTLTTVDGKMKLVAYDTKASVDVRRTMVDLLTRRLRVNPECPLLETALTAELQTWVDGTLDEIAFRTQHNYIEEA